MRNKRYRYFRKLSDVFERTHEVHPDDLLDLKQQMQMVASYLDAAIERNVTNSGGRML
jgi:hypothetical protein